MLPRLEAPARAPGAAPAGQGWEAAVDRARPQLEEMCAQHGLEWEELQPVLAAMYAHDTSAKR